MPEGQAEPSADAERVRDAQRGVLQAVRDEQLGALGGCAPRHTGTDATVDRETRAARRRAPAGTLADDVHVGTDGEVLVVVVRRGVPHAEHQVYTRIERDEGAAAARERAGEAALERHAPGRREADSDVAERGCEPERALAAAWAYISDADVHAELVTMAAGHRRGAASLR